MKQIIKKGDSFGRLTAVRFDHWDKWGCQLWLFKCDCGIEKVIRVKNVKSGNTKSCGCLFDTVKTINGKKNITHGMRKTITYNTWAGMIQRCLNENHPKYKDWGGRGIKVCPEWLGANGFENFFDDMGERPEGKTLDRIENDKGYCKSNCRYATPKQQSNNRRSNHLLTYGGKTQTITRWAEELCINPSTLKMRIYSGWSIERALSTLI